MNGVNAAFGHNVGNNAPVGGATAFSRPSYTGLNNTSSFLNPTNGVGTNLSSLHGGGSFLRGQSSSLSGSTWGPASTTLPTKFPSTSFRDYTPLSNAAGITGRVPMYSSSSFSQSVLPSSFSTSSFANKFSASQVPSLVDTPVNQGAFARVCVHKISYSVH